MVSKNSLLTLKNILHDLKQSWEDKEDKNILKPITKNDLEFIIMNKGIISSSGVRNYIHVLEIKEIIKLHPSKNYWLINYNSIEKEIEILNNLL